jgi:putative protease
MKPELLAPAKNADIAIAAINHGADAVYIGGQRFGAREAAGNSIQNIAKAVKYAHRYAAKVYLTLNAILKENELEEAKKLAATAYEIGCDALIIQDMALLEMDLPPIPLHASTQTHNATPEKVKFLQDVGFKRVVLARELSIPEIVAIRAATTVELENFIHGALCVSYSGQCYLSQNLANRSANRGVCAQPCRSTYNLIDGNNNILLKNKHLLSLRDLNLTNQIAQLAQAGICSFKIEGRLKDADYVKNTVAHYRKAIDNNPCFKGQKTPSFGQVELNFEPQPEKTFSRGFTTYFVENDQQKIASHSTAKAIGEEIGTVQAADKETITVKFAKNKTADIHSGDGVCFVSSQGKLLGTNVNKSEGNRLWLQNMEGMQKGSTLYRNYDHLFQKQLANPNSAQRLIGVEITFEATEKSVRLTATDESGLTTSLAIEKQQVEANSKEKVLATIAEQFSKQSSSTFKVLKTNINCCNTYFYTISELNSWRRALLKDLEQKRDNMQLTKNQTFIKNAIHYPESSLSFKANVLNSLSKQFYERHGVQKIAPAYEVEKPKSEVELMATRYCLLRELGHCKQDKSTKKLQEPLCLENNGKRLRLQFDCKNCKMYVMG